MALQRNNPNDDRIDRLSVVKGLETARNIPLPRFDRAHASSPSPVLQPRSPPHPFPCPANKNVHQHRAQSTSCSVHRPGPASIHPGHFYVHTRREAMPRRRRRGPRDRPPRRRKRDPRAEIALRYLERPSSGPPSARTRPVPTDRGTDGGGAADRRPSSPPLRRLGG